jgi:anaphase-promoting complex subunit 6
MTHQYSRAERLLTRPFPTTPPKQVPAFSTPSSSNSPPLTNGYASHYGQSSYYKGKGREVPHSNFPLPSTSLARLPMGPGGMIEIPEDMLDGVSRLVDMSVACRYLAAQCMVRQGNWADATEMLGEANPFRDSGRSGATIPNVDGGIKVCV